MLLFIFLIITPLIWTIVYTISYKLNERNKVFVNKLFDSICPSVFKDLSRQGCYKTVEGVESNSVEFHNANTWRC